MNANLFMGGLAVSVVQFLFCGIQVHFPPPPPPHSENIDKFTAAECYFVGDPVVLDPVLVVEILLTTSAEVPGSNPGHVEFFSPFPPLSFFFSHSFFLSEQVFAWKFTVLLFQYILKKLLFYFSTE